MATGSLIGGAIGTGVGLAAGLPPEVTAKVGATAGGAIETAIKKKKAEAALPLAIDPVEQLALDRLTARATSFKTGTANSRVMAALKEADATAVTRAFSGGGMRAGLNAIDETFNKGIIAINNANNNAALQYDSMATQLASKIADRKWQKSMILSSMKSADAANEAQATNANAGGVAVDAATGNEATDGQGIVNKVLGSIAKKKSDKSFAKTSKILSTFDSGADIAGEAPVMPVL